ncbi:MAG: hypothetical protein WCT04_23870 [Planctomycetota bacterium]
MKWMFAVMCVLISAVCTGAEGEPNRPKVTVLELMAKDFPKETSSHGRMLTAKFDPGAGSNPHTQPGAIFAYVLEGAVVSSMNKYESKTHKKGESWYEHPGCVNSLRLLPPSIIQIIINT